MTLTQPASLPGWLPDAARLYLHHTERGVSLRELARTKGVHASTVLRQVRRYETRREDPLVDGALSALGLAGDGGPHLRQNHEVAAVSDSMMEQEGRRILRRLAEPDTVLGIALDMDKAAVLRAFTDGRTVRMAVMDRSVAEAFALKDWIVCRKPGRIATYEITPAGRAALRRLELQARGSARMEAGFAEASGSFAGHPVAWDSTEDGERKQRHTTIESPVAVLARRRDKDGKLFLDQDLVDAAERLREDYEIARIGNDTEQAWNPILTGLNRSGETPAKTPATPGERVSAALAYLGPSLGHMALRCCCHLEGVETAEQNMGWSARSGKIVLRIALERLRDHYTETYGKYGPLIG